MSNAMNRRKWLKTSTLVTGGLTLLSGTLPTLIAHAAPRIRTARALSDAEFGETAPRVLKARLFANENPFGPSDKVKKAIIDSLSISYQYPFFQVDDLDPN